MSGIAGVPEYIGGPSCGREVPAHLRSHDRIIVEGKNRSGRVPLYLYLRSEADYRHAGEYDYAKDAPR